MSGLKFIDLFCGIGGFRLALEAKGLECVFSSDIDPFVKRAYAKNFGDGPQGDITQIDASRIPKHDVLCAGFPCQSFSISGKQEGLSDARGCLFFDVLRIAAYHKPRVLLLENVKNILSIRKGEIATLITEKIWDTGYYLYRFVLNSSFFGIPQARERVYFVGLRKDTHLVYKPPQETFEKIFLEDILEKEVDERLFITRGDIEITETEENLVNRLRLIRVGIVNKGGQGERIYSPKGHAVTISAYGGGAGARTGLYNTAQGVRRLTVLECKRAMGFPEEHYVSQGLRGCQQLGNAVIPKMVEHVFEGIKGL